MQSTTVLWIVLVLVGCSHARLVAFTPEGRQLAVDAGPKSSELPTCVSPDSLPLRSAHEAELRDSAFAVWLRQTSDTLACVAWLNRTSDHMVFRFQTRHVVLDGYFWIAIRSDGTREWTAGP